LDSRLGDLLFLFFITFQTFPLGVRFRLQMAFALWLAFGRG